MTGTVFDIQRFSIHDGPGIRTSVFLKGCPLRCIWCHNPESVARSRELQFNPLLCIGCLSCFAACRQGAHVQLEGEHRILRDRCRSCFACAEGCFARALEVVGEEMSSEQVLAEVLKDRPFYEQSGGGMTLSGGEPMAQPAFSLELLRLAGERGIRTCLETCGFGRAEDFAAAVDTVDLFLFDLKETDPVRHREYTGQELRPILANLRLIDALGAAIVLRCPLIPGHNLRDEHLHAVAEVSRSLRGCVAVEVMGYHRLGESKLERLGVRRSRRVDPGIPDMTDAEVEQALDRIRELGGVSARRS